MNSTALSRRFWRKVDLSGDCWLWTGATNDRGYPRWAEPSDNGGQRQWYAHRWAWTEQIGSIPDDMTVDHLCQNIRCVRPAHLELVTKAENTARRWERVRSSA